MSLSPRTRRWGIAAFVLLVLALAYQQLGLGQWLTLDQLKASRDALVGHYQSDPWLTVTAFFGVYVLASALSLPGASILTLAGGAMFGLGVGLLLVSFASSVGALAAFWVSRTLLRDMVQQRFGKLLTTGGTMLLSVVVYAFVFGWRYAVGFVVLLFIHEMGHFIAARQRSSRRPRTMGYFTRLALYRYQL